MGSKLEGMEKLQRENGRLTTLYKAATTEIEDLNKQRGEDWEQIRQFEETNSAFIVRCVERNCRCLLSSRRSEDSPRRSSQRDRSPRPYPRTVRQSPTTHTAPPTSAPLNSRPNSPPPKTTSKPLSPRRSIPRSSRTSRLV